MQIAIGSFLDEYSNKVQVLSMNKDKLDWEVVHELAHPYPPTKIGFVPDAQTERTNLMATCGDYLRIWELDENGVKSTRKLSGVSSVRAHQGMDELLVIRGACAPLLNCQSPGLQRPGRRWRKWCTPQLPGVPMHLTEMSFVSQ